MIIRQANIRDCKRISYLIKKNTEKVFENQYSPIQKSTWIKYNSPTAIKKQLAEREIYCAFENQKLLGTIGLNNSEIVGLYVSYSKRGKGIGKSLLKHIETIALNKGITELTLTATPSSIKFYISQGYIINEVISVNINNVEYKETLMTKEILTS